MTETSPSIVDSTAFKLHRVTALLDRVADAYLRAEHGIRYPAFLVLLMVRVLGEPSQQRIAANLGVSRASVTQRVGALVGDGLLAIRTDPADSRANVVTLTARGAALLDAAWNGLDTHQAGLDDGVDEDALARAARPDPGQRRPSGAAMKVHETGEPAGEPLVFLHGGNVAGWMWGMQLPAFEDFRQLVPDLPGFGESNDEPWVSIADTADRVAAMLAERDTGAAHVVGLSLGSSVAIELAARHPELVRSLFLASAQVAPPRRRSMLLARAMLRFWEQRGFWASTARSYGLRGEDADLFVETGLGIRRETAIAIYDEVCRGVPAETLARVTAPVIAVAGDRDSPAIHRDSLDRLRAEVPHSLVAVAPGMHHQWNIEDVELFNAALRSWLTSREVSALLEAR